MREELICKDLKVLLLKRVLLELMNVNLEQINVYRTSSNLVFPVKRTTLLQ